MSNTLAERLLAAKSQLRETEAAIRRWPNALPLKVEESFLSVAETQCDFDHWTEMIGVRESAFQFLEQLPDQVQNDPKRDDTIQLGNHRVAFARARHQGVTSYLAAAWALSDQIVMMAGQILCTPDGGRNESERTSLVSHFIQRENAKRRTAAVLFDSVKASFGWPVGLGYAIRNHFLHDGGYSSGASFFHGTSADAAFQISPNAWEKLTQFVKKQYGVSESDHRGSARWPRTPTDDLRLVLRACETEIDDALGVLIGSACQSLLIHVGFMLGEA